MICLVRPTDFWARGRDATAVAIVTSFGPCTLVSFKVITDELTPSTSTSLC